MIRYLQNFIVSLSFFSKLMAQHSVTWVQSEMPQIVHLSSVVDVVQVDRLRSHTHPVYQSNGSDNIRLANVVQLQRNNCAPQIVSSFIANEFGGNPNDNSVAVSPDGLMLAIQNKYIYAFHADGKPIFLKSLRAFLGTTESTIFDPRVVFDPEERKFVVLMLSGKTYQESKLYLCFSQTIDPAGNWNVLSLNGNPFQDNTWSDFPALALTPTEIVVTSNSYFNGSVSNSGFKHTIVWRIPKKEGFAGKPLQAQVLAGAEVNGKPLFNLTPANEWFDSTNEILLLGNETFTGGQTFYAVNIIDNRLDVKTIESNIAYGVPPFVRQKGTTTLLNTNDCRILDATQWKGKTYFVFNTAYNNGCSIFLGKLLYNGNEYVLDSHIITDSVDIAFPSIATLRKAGQELLMLGYLHASPTTHPGSSVLEIDISGNTLAVSQPTRIKNGNDYFAVWGDYTDLKTMPDGEAVLFCGSFGLSQGSIGGGESATVMAIVAPSITVGIEQSVPTDFSLFPNPAQQIVQIEMTPIRSEAIDIHIYDSNGRAVAMASANVQERVRYRCTINTTDLTTGIYTLLMTCGKRKLTERKLVIQK